MSENRRGTHTAAPSALGYLYQVRLALLEALRRQPGEEEFSISVETLDDVVFEKEGAPTELFQTKHHVRTAADLTDGSVDLWKTLRVWCDAAAEGRLPGSSLLFLMTTAKAAEGHAAHYLRCSDSRDPETAMQRLCATADSSTSKENAAAYAAFRKLDLDQRCELVQSLYVLDSAPDIRALEDELKKVVYFAVESKFLESFLQRLEGWWLRRAIHHLCDSEANAILSEELASEISALRDQFKQDNLPIDDDIMCASVDASGYQERPFVHQLHLIDVGSERVFHAIRNYFRAFEQRSRWVREDLLFVGDLGRYEDKLIEEWDVLFQQMRDALGEAAAEDAKTAKAQELYRWIETASHHRIREGVSEPAIARGTYQMLSDKQRIGWHLEFKERLDRLLNRQEAEL